jgi:hypothetical protein
MQAHIANCMTEIGKRGSKNPQKAMAPFFQPSRWISNFDRDAIQKDVLSLNVCNQQ